MHDALTAKVQAAYRMQFDPNASQSLFRDARIRFASAYKEGRAAADTNEDRRLVGGLGQVSDEMDLDFAVLDSATNRAGR